MLIDDGSGDGFRAKVDDENRLFTDTVNSDYPFHANNMHGTAYVMDIDGVQTAGANQWLAVIKNTDDLDLIITSVVGWVPSFDNTQIYEVYLGGTFTYTANGTAVVPTNMNAGSGNSATGDFYVNDGVGDMATIVAGSIAGRYVFSTTPLKWSNRSGWIVTKNQCFMLRSDLGEKLTGYISFYYHNHQ